MLLSLLLTALLELIGLILYLLIITVLSFILENFVFRWEFWVIMAAITVLRVVDAHYMLSD
jgi:hypothetical protein